MSSKNSSTNTQFVMSSNGKTAVLLPDLNKSTIISIGIPNNGITTSTNYNDTPTKFTFPPNSGNLNFVGSDRVSALTPELKSNKITSFCTSLEYKNNLIQVVVGNNTISRAEFGSFSNVIVPKYEWTTVVMSSNGQYITAISKTHEIYNSSDKGLTFNPITVSNETLGWYFCAMSIDGQYQLASSSSNSLYKSIDFGKTWGSISLIYPASSTTVRWTSVSVSATGQYQTASTSSSGIYFTKNYGQTWNNTNWTNDNWTVLGMSATGQYQTVAGPNPKAICYSGDYGQTFTPTISGIKGRNDNTFNPIKITISASGRYQSICDNLLGIYSSIDYGQSWYLAHETSGGVVFNDIKMSNFYNINTQNNTSTTILINEDGKYQFCGTINGGCFYSDTYGQSWTKNTSFNAQVGSFVYNSLINPTDVILIGIDSLSAVGISKETITVVGNPSTKSNCYQSELTYTPSFRSSIQSTGAHIASSKLTLQFSQMKTIVNNHVFPYWLGMSDYSSDLILFDTNSTSYVNNISTYSYKGTIQPMILMFDPIIPDFCGQTNEYKVSIDPSSISYYFVSDKYIFQNTLKYPLNPVDENGIVKLGEVYTLPLLISTLKFMLINDIKSKSNIIPQFDSNYTLDTSGNFKDLYIGFASTYKTPSSLTLLASQNIVFSNAFNTNGYDIFISNVDSNSYDPSPGIILTTILSKNISPLLSYTISDTTGSSYTGSLNLPIENTPEYLLETILPKLLVNNINSNTSNKYALPQYAIKVETTGSKDNINEIFEATMYQFYLNVNLRNILITLHFSRNKELGNALGITRDLSIFHLNPDKTFTSTNLSKDIMLHEYKGWNYYLLRGEHYLYINPYLVKINEIPSSSNEIPVTRSDLANYYKVQTSTNEDDVYYYTKKNNVDEFFVLIDEKFTYEINLGIQIKVDSGRPESLGFDKLKTEYGLEYYRNPNPDWYVMTNDNNLLQIDTVLQLSINDPNKLSYTFNNSSLSFTSSITLPIQEYSGQKLASTLISLLTRDIALKYPISADVIQITYEPLDNSNTILQHTYSFIIKDNFQLILKTKDNLILASALGVSDDIYMNPVFSPVNSLQSCIQADPHHLPYQFTDNNYSFSSFITLPINATPTNYINQLTTLLIADLKLFTNYKLTNDMLSITYVNGVGYTFLFNPIPNRSATIEFLFNKTVNATLYPAIPIPLSTWAKTFGFTTNLIIRAGTSITSTIPPVVVNPFQITYSLSDVSSNLRINSNITFDENLFAINSDNDIATPLTTLLIQDINQRQSKYTLTQNDISVIYDSGNRTFSFSLLHYPLSLTIHFGLSPFVGINYGCLADITLLNSYRLLSTTISTEPFYVYKDIPMFFYKNKFCTFINSTKNGKGLYALSTGSSFCIDNTICNEVVIQDNTLPLSYYGYNKLPNGNYYEKYNNYVYDTNTQILFLLLSLVTDTFYGSITNNGFVPLNYCTLDRDGNCIPPSLPLYTLNNQTFYIVQKDTLHLLAFSRDSLTEVNCPCKITATIIPTCNEICRSKTSNQLNLPNGSNDPLLCSNPNDDPLTTPCSCYYNGPVNVIIKPMQEYNPFRLIKTYAGIGLKTASDAISNKISSFMLPLWNTVKLCTGLMSSIIYMIVETITTYANPVYVFNLLKNLVSMGAEEAMAQLNKFVTTVVVPGLNAIWNLKDYFINELVKISGIIWENIKVVLKLISDALVSFLFITYRFTKTIIGYTWNKSMQFLGVISDTFLPFIPSSNVLKTNLLLFILLGILAIVFGLDRYLTYLWKFINFIFSLILNFFVNNLVLLKGALLF